jgi:hypothetical protein
MENSYAAEQLCYNACNSAPITPRSPSFIGYSEEVSRTPAEEAQCVERDLHNADASHMGAGKTHKPHDIAKPVS